MVPPKPPVNGMSIASLILGVVWIGGLGSLLAVIFGFIAKKRIKDSNGQQGGAGLAIAGIILGFLGLAATVLFWVLVLAVTHGVNQFANSYTDGRNYGVAHYSANGDVNAVCNSAPVPSGDDSTEFNLGCLAGWASSSTSSGNSGSSGNVTTTTSGNSGNVTTTTSGNSGGGSGNTGNSG